MALAYSLDYANRLRDALAAWDHALALPGLAERADLRWQAIANRSAALAKIGHAHASAEAAEQALSMSLASGELPEVRAMQTQSPVANRLRDVGRYGDALVMLEQAYGIFKPTGLQAELASAEHGLTVIYQHLGQPERAQALLAADRAGLQPGLTLMRLVHRADLRRQLSGDGLALLREAQALIPDPNDTYHRIATLFATWAVPLTRARR